MQHILLVVLPLMTTLCRRDTTLLLEGANLDKVLQNDNPKHPLSVEALLKFATSIYADENVRFLMDYEHLRSLRNKSSMKILVKRYGNHLNLPNEVQAQFLSGEPHGIQLAYFHIYELVKTDILPKFLKTLRVRKKLDESRESALWWKKKQTLRTFFSFPDSVLTIDARLHALLCSIFICSGILVYLSFNQEYGIFFWLFYGYATRYICGPKLDPQSYIVIFILRPFVIRTKILDIVFVNSFLQRITQAVGAAVTFLILVFCYSDMTIEFCAFSGMIGLFSSINALFGYCVLCVVLSKFAKWKILPDRFDHCKEDKMFGIANRESRQQIDSVILMA